MKMEIVGPLKDRCGCEGKLYVSWDNDARSKLGCKSWARLNFLSDLDAQKRKKGGVKLKSQS